MSGCVPVVGPEPRIDSDRRSSSGASAGVGGGARGWNADQFGRRLRLVPSTTPRGLERDRTRWVVVGTLLGPEGTGDCFFCGGLHARRTARVSGVWRWGRWSDFPYFENCTVD